MDLVVLLRWVKIDFLVKMQTYVSIIKGWNSWNHYYCSINETIVRQTADTIVATGLAAAGYQYSLSFVYFL